MQKWGWGPCLMGIGLNVRRLPENGALSDQCPIDLRLQWPGTRIQGNMPWEAHSGPAECPHTQLVLLRKVTGSGCYWIQNSGVSHEKIFCVGGSLPMERHALACSVIFCSLAKSFYHIWGRHSTDLLLRLLFLPLPSTQTSSSFNLSHIQSLRTVKINSSSSAFTE